MGDWIAPAEYLQPELRLAAALKALRLSSSVRVAARSATSSWHAHLQLGHTPDRVVHLTDGQAEPVPEDPGALTASPGDQLVDALRLAFDGVAVVHGSSASLPDSGPVRRCPLSSASPLLL